MDCSVLDQGKPILKFVRQTDRLTIRGGARNFCLGGPKIQGVWMYRDLPLPPGRSRWICVITASVTGRRWWSGNQESRPPPPLGQREWTANWQRATISWWAEAG